MVTNSDVLVIGAGLSGPVIALLLAQQGFCVQLFDRRSDIRTYPDPQNMSVNMTLAYRGIRALAQVGVLPSIMAKAIPLTGRMIHRSNGTRIYQPYGKNSKEVIYSVQRHDMNTTLLNAVESQRNVRLHFEKKCLQINKDSLTALFMNTDGSQDLFTAQNFIVGADGVYSTVRREIHRNVPNNFKQEILEWGYRELHISNTCPSARLEANMFHMWPRGNHMLMAVPNINGSFTCTCVLPLQGVQGFTVLNDPQTVSNFFLRNFGDVAHSIDNLEEAFLRAPTGNFITTYVSPWHYKDRLVLVGDACHSFVPFYGQGMNSSLEDCQILNSLVRSNRGDLLRAFQQYEKTRKPDIDIMADVSKEHFAEICARVHSYWFILMKRLDIFMNKVLPKFWIPLYSLIMYTDTPYASAVRRVKRQRITLVFLLAASVISTLVLMIARLFTRDEDGNTD